MVGTAEQQVMDHRQQEYGQPLLGRGVEQQITDLGILGDR
jgi:hypothetical protein